MALLWVEGFETYGSSGRPSPDAVMSRKYFTYNLDLYDDIVAGRTGYGYHLNSTASYIRTRNLTTDRTMISGAAVLLTNPASSAYLTGFYQGATRALSIYYDGSGELEIRRGSTVLAATTSLGLVTGVWYYIELKAYCDNSVGTYEVRISGVNVLSDTGVDTRVSATIDYYTSTSFGTGATLIKIDDWYVCDASGTANNDFLGNMEVETIYPTSDDTVTWTPDTGATNYTQIDDAVVVDANYVEASSGQDMYGYGNLITTSGTIKGIMVSTDAELTDSTSQSLITVVESNATEGNETHTSIGIGPASFDSVFEEDPDTSAAWLYTAVNAATFGIEVA